MKRSITLKPEHLAMMMIVGVASEDPRDYGADLLGIVRGLYNYSRGESIENAALTEAARWAIEEIVEDQEENNG